MNVTQKINRLKVNLGKDSVFRSKLTHFDENSKRSKSAYISAIEGEYSIDKLSEKAHLITPQATLEGAEDPVIVYSSEIKMKKESTSLRDTLFKTEVSADNRDKYTYNWDYYIEELKLALMDLLRHYNENAKRNEELTVSRINSDTFKESFVIDMTAFPLFGLVNIDNNNKSIVDLNRDSGKGIMPAALKTHEVHDIARELLNHGEIIIVSGQYELESVKEFKAYVNDIEYNNCSANEYVFNLHKISLLNIYNNGELNLAMSYDVSTIEKYFDLEDKVYLLPYNETTIYAVHTVIK